MSNRYLRLGAFAVLFVAIATWALTAGGQQPQSYVPRQVIIKLDPSTPTADALAVRSSLRASVKHRFKSSGAELWVIDGIEVNEAVNRFKDDPRVDYIEPNYMVRTLDVFPNDPRFDDLWGMHNTGQTGGTPDADIDAPEAWELGTGGTVLVGVIDTGVDYNHVDLAGNMFTNPNEIPGNGVDDDFNGYIDDVRGWDFVNGDNNPIDDHGHGTHVSGTIGAIGNNGVGVVGVSWTVRIMPLKFLDAGGFGSTSDAVLAVEYATMMGAKLTSNSWGGGGFSQALYDAIEAAGNAGVLFVAAAGNASSNNDVFPNFPSNYDLENIIAVASTDHRDQLSGFSNFGLTTVDLGAPGTDILSTFPNNTYGTISGTSMATPHVSGAVCLLWAAAPEMTHMEVKNTIMASVDVIPALQGRTVTGGRLNVFNILSGLDDVPPDPIHDLSVQSTGSTTALLAWTATGDDGAVGTARTYDLRFSTSPIDAGNFDLATSAGTLPAPRAVGAPESFEVSGLDYNTTYYFAMVVEDEQQNRSGVSNSPNGTTLGAPVLAYAPNALSSNLLTGGTETQILTISNTGEGTLDFAFPTSPVETGAIGGVAPTMMPMWLSANPSSGRVLAGESMQVELTFDATGLSGGDYGDIVTFATNDHTQESAPVDVALHVTGAPDVVASPLEIDYGVRYTGSCTTLEIVVTNRGFEPLDVSGVSINNAIFTTDPAGFVLGVGGSRTLQVNYCPLSDEAMPGIPRRYPRRSSAVLALATNDPDHPTYSVSLFGDAIAPPVIVVNPTSLSEDLFTGGSATHSLSIMNDGATDLEFALAVEDLGSGATVRFGTAATTPDRREDITPAGTKTTKRGPDYTGGRAGTGRRELASAVPTITSASALEILLVHAADVSEIQSALLAFPDVAAVDAFDAGSTTPTLAQLEPYDGVILIANFSYSDPEALGDVLADYVDGGGGVVMTLASFIDGWDVGGRFFADGYYPFTIGSGPVGFGTLADFQASHPIMAGVSSATGDLLGATTLAPGAEWVADWDIGQPFIATQGDHVVGANVFVADGGFWSGDVALILHNAVLWSAGAAWLTAEPTEGVVPPGSALDVAVTFDAAGLFGGDYAANLRIGSNDPVTPEVVVPANLHVTGAPDLDVSETALAYGQVFVGGTSSKTVVVSNAGTDVLNISSIASSHPSYTVDVASMTLAPATSQNIVVSFAPTSTGAANGTLTFTSDDPDEPSLAVALEGEGILPPIISVTPMSFDEDLFTGETASHTMTIANSGASNLLFEIDAVEIEAMGATVTQRISIPRSSGEFPRGSHAPSLRAAPSSGGASGPSSLSATPLAAVGSAFATEIGFGQATRFGLGSPEVLNFIGPVPAWIWAGDFGGDELAYAYAVDEFNQFMQIDTTSGAQTILGTISPFGSEIWTGMAFDPTDGLMYATSTNVSTSSFYVIDVTVPSATRIGSIGAPGIIALAIDDTGAAFAYDIVTDEMLSIDKTTGAGTTIGSLGFDANFGQGMGFDAESGQLYLAAFNNSTFQAELRVADRTTGATALVGVLGATQPGDVVQLGFLALPGLGGARWLLADPDEGVVPPGTSMDVAVTFDAEGLFGGDYNANLVIANNDPLNPEVLVAAHLHVTGAPDIQVTPVSLDYGPVFIGGVSNRTVIVKNVGTDLLTVTSISSDHGDYSADVTNVVLAPTASQAVVVSYAPTSTGISAATLTIASDDPDEASVTVPMTGEGRMPPIISVSPTSFAEDLFTGETAAHTLTISNTGASDLEFAIAVEDLTVGAAASRAVLLRGHPWRERALRGGGAVGVNVEGADSRASQTRTAILPTTNAPAAEDAAILVIQDTEAWGLDMASFIFENFAITATVINSGQIAATDFAPFDLVITVGDEGFSYYNALSSNVAKFEDYVSGGGVVQYQLATQGDDVTIVGGVNVIFGNLESFNDVVAPDHPIVEGLPLVLEGNAANHTYLMGLPGDALVITETSGSGDPTTVEYEFGLGSVIASGMTWEWLYLNGYEAGAMLGNAVAYSLSIAGVKWIQVEPPVGVVPPGTSMDVAVTFDATGLYGGDYLANLLVDNNDPLNPQVAVPASLHVTGAPDITVSDTVLDYGPVFVGGMKQKTVVVANDGTDLLNVSSIVSSHPDYTVDVSVFSLAPEASQNVVVTYAPTTVAPSAGTLTITSDDPDEGVIVIAMQGEGLEPPVISVSPLSFEADLFTGETNTQTMTISNSGGNNLTFNIKAEEIEAMAATVAQRISIPRSSGDFPRGTHAPSLRSAPNIGPSTRGNASDPGALAAVGSAFSMEIGFSQATRFSLGTPEVLNFVGSVPAWIWAGDFGGDDLAYAYAVNEFNQFMQMDTTSGAQTILGTMVPFGSEIWTGMAFDPSDGLMYATSTDIFASSFYVIDVTVPSATRIGSIGSPGIIAVAIDDEGAVFAYDIVTDEMVSIDKTTGAGTTIGSLGFDANFGQGMGFDADSGQLYLAAFNNVTFQAELRIADRTTGATALVGVLGATQPGGTTQLGFLALPGLGGAQWLIADPNDGVVPPGTSMDVAVTFDAAGLYGGDYNANLAIANNDPLNPEVLVPAHLHVTGAPDIAVTPASFDYGPVFIGAVSNKALEIKNAGTDVLTVSSIVTTHTDYTTSAANAVIAPGTSQMIIVSYAPTSTGINNATLTITSDDPDEAVVNVSLTGEGLEPPVISVTPLSMSEDLFTGGSATQTLTIDNSAGGSVLVWSASPAFPDNTSSVVEASAIFGSGEVVDLKKDPKRIASAARPDANAVFAFGARGAEKATAAVATSLEDILANLDANFGSVNSLIPNRFDFTEGEVGNSIGDGGNDMYDGGNMLGTNLGGPIMYSNGVVVPSATFGPGGRYFTRKYPGLFVMVADMTAVEYFEIFGNLGADGSGNVDGAVLAAAVSGISFQGFVKRVYNAFDPSVNHLILVEENPTAAHEFATNTDDDYHRAFGLSDSRRVYYVLYASANGGYVDNTATLAITEAFLNALGLAPGWVSIVPDAGSVPAGASVDVDVTFDAEGLNGGDYDANILVANNDPLNPEVVVTTHLHVTGAPDIAVNPTALDFGQLFVGDTADQAIEISNGGTDVLTVGSIAANHPDYSVSASNAVLPPGGSLVVTVTYAPTTAAVHNAILTIASDDPDEGSLPVTLAGEGLEPPVIAVTPTSISEDVFSGAVVYRTLNIDNSAGGSNLFWTATASAASDSGAVVASSPTFGTGVVVDLKKEAKPTMSAAQPDPGALFTFPAPAAAQAPVAAAITLETVLENLNNNFGAVTSGIPNRFDFTEGVSGNNILDGGNDMYDGGNYLGTNFVSGISYADNAIIGHPAFGPGGRYFTRKYPGLFVLVADISNVDYFQIFGNLGADGLGNADGAVLAAEVSGVSFRGFVKRVYNASGPSVNHLILVEENPAASHSFSTFTDDDFHVAFGLFGSTRIYYLLYASSGGGYIDNTATLGIMEAFLNSIMGPEWIRMAPTSGTVPAGSSANVQVTLDAAGLFGGDYYANINVASNDPVSPEVAVPVHLHVTGASDIDVSPAFVAFGQVFMGATAQAPLTVTNNGTDVLEVSNIASSPPQFGTDLTSFALAPGASQTVMVSFAPDALGMLFGTLTLYSNDPDEGTVAVYAFGEGVQPPVISLSAASLSADLAEGESNTQILTVSNVGANVLDFSVSIEPGDALLAAMESSGHVAAGADGGRAVADGGGPDYFGYFWRDSNEPDGPVFEWIDASGGTDVSVSESGFVEGVPLGFAFHYYGFTFTTVGVCADGWLSFNGATVGFPGTVPLLDVFVGPIAPYARDLSPAGAAYIRYQTVGTAPNRRFVIEYNTIPDQGGGNHKTFEVIFAEGTNSIRFQYLVAPNDPEGFGIESPDQSYGMGDGGLGDMFIDPALVEDNYAIEFIGRPTWLEVTPLGGSAIAGGGVDLSVTFDASGLANGDYAAELVVLSNDPANPSVTVPVILTVSNSQVSAIDTDAVPTEFGLHDNRPNPFNPTTTIAYDLPQGVEVKLVVYDVSGREVRELVNTRQPAGRHSIVWDGRNASSDYVASGVYFYRLTAGSFVRTKKMVLLK